MRPGCIWFVRSAGGRTPRLAGGRQARRRNRHRRKSCGTIPLKIRRRVRGWSAGIRISFLSIMRAGHIKLHDSVSKHLFAPRYAPLHFARSDVNAQISRVFFRFGRVLESADIPLNLRSRFLAPRTPGPLRFEGGFAFGTLNREALGGAVSFDSSTVAWAQYRCIICNVR